MASPAELVSSTFSQAMSYANAAKAESASFIAALNGLVYAPPTISVNWATIAAPSLPTLPAQPTMPTIAFVPPSEPAAFVLAEPAFTVDEFTGVAPTLAFPTAPVISYGALPTIPDVAEVTLPTAPTLTLPSAPTLAAVTLPSTPSISLPSVPSYLALSTPAFGGVDLNEAYLDNLTTIPTLSLVAPTPYSYSVGPEYASTLLTNVQALINTRLAGGTGLNPTVEQAIWDRARVRETAVWQANEAEALRTSEALGFQLPPGVVAAQVRDAQQMYFEKLTDQNREISIKQADLEQENLKQSIAAGIDLEGKLIDYSLQLERIAFDSARELASNTIASYNAQVDKYKALLTAYQTYAQAYQAIIDGQMAKVEAYKAQMVAEQTKADMNRTLAEQFKTETEAAQIGVEVYKAQIEGERAKAEVNKTLVDQYRAGMEAALAHVEIYKAQLAGAETLVTIEQAKISAAGERVRGYVAQVNAETAKIEGYKAGVQAEAVKVEAYKAEADAFAATAGAQAEVARLELGRYEVLARVKTNEWEGYRARVEAERSRLAALGLQSTSLLDGYKAAAVALESSANMHTRVWEGQIKNYEASQQISIQAAKINGDNLIQANNARLDAAKVGAQVYAQLAASAYSMMNAQAGISGSGNSNESVTVQFQYEGKTSDERSAPGLPGSIDV